MRHTYTESLRRIAPVLAEHEHGPEMLRALAAFEREDNAGYEDPAGFDTAEAVYYVSLSWHAGQTCPLYAAGCATEFHPGMGWRKPEGYTARAAAAALLRILRN